ncbi:class I SAM-dependent methyltransferase [Nonomuraea sp. NPDC050394]|uniref:class I SAM-dependent methyltransferase n=1 Tax=Nonomuraea sp. NPDC050394 TaxID=3364363 RepID=UPI0037A634D4
MPTIASGREPHEHREIAESFGNDAERYDRARPRYPEALIERIAAAGPDVLDVGCGTGIAARQFQAAGRRVLGVEPDARMAATARRLGVAAEVATFEQWQAGGRMFDAVAAAQAWHWIDPVAGAAKAAAVLRPGGLLAVFWNVARPPDELSRALADLHARLVPGSPFDPRAWASRAEPYAPMMATAVEGIAEAGGFGEPERWRQDWQTPCTREQWLDQLPTSGMFTRLAPERVADLLEGAGAAVDALGGTFTMRYTSVAVLATRLTE